MGFYGPKKTHIKRIFGRQRKDDGTTEDVREVYADVERADSLPTVEWPGAQENQINLQWRDEPGEDGNPGRRLSNVRLTDPEDDSDDPDTWIDIPTIDRMTMVRHPGAQEIVTTFQPSAADPVAEDLVTAREVAVRRVPFCETTVDDVLDATGYLAYGEDYERKMETLDDTQYLDAEIIESYPSKVYNGPSPQDIKVSLDNDALKEAYAEPPSDAKRPPLRLDPFQNIRNVSWGAGATEFPLGSTLHRGMTSDTSTMTIALWVRFPQVSPVPPTTILSFGRLTADDGIDVVSYIGTKGGVGPSMEAVFYGPAGSVTARPPVGPDLPANPYIIMSPVGACRDDWNFVGLSFDLSSKLISTVLNTEVSPLHEAPIACSYHNEDGTVLGSSEIQDGDLSIVTMSGFDFAIPVIVPLLGGSSGNINSARVALGSVQVWLDQFIDFSSDGVIEKFMRPDRDDPTKPRMVAPSVAQKAFGKPTFFFDGRPSKFVKNQGTGGEFTKTGDLKSFRPAPPRATSS